MRVRIATLNVWALPEPFARDVDARIGAIGERIARLDVDVVAFQEVWTPRAREQLIDAGRDAGLDHAWHRDLPGGGLLLLSRLPVRDVHFERFVLPGVPQRLTHADTYGGKGFARVQLEHAGVPFTVVATHLHARYPDDVSHEYLAQRTGQVVQLAMAVRQATEPVVAVGDFNFREGQPEHVVLTGLTGLRDIAAELDRRQPTVFRTNAYRTHTSKPDRRIDYVFARDGERHALQARRLERVFDEPVEIGGSPRAYSNHAGLLAEVEIGSHAPAAIEAGPRTAERTAVELATRLLSQGRARAEERRHAVRSAAGIGLGAAILAAGGGRTRPVNRRRALRAMLQVAAVVTLTPGVALGVLSEVFVPNEIRAFDALEARLAAVDLGDHSLAWRAGPGLARS